MCLLSPQIYVPGYTKPSIFRRPEGFIHCRVLGKKDKETSLCCKCDNAGDPMEEKLPHGRMKSERKKRQPTPCRHAITLVEKKWWI
jgi:hypothetical protein